MRGLVVCWWACSCWVVCWSRRCCCLSGRVLPSVCAMLGLVRVVLIWRCWRSCWACFWSCWGLGGGVFFMVLFYHC